MENIFDAEINYIHEERIRECAKKLVGMLPDYFFEVAASSTGKYHPKVSNLEGGLVNHTKIAVRFAKEFFNNGIIFNSYTEHDQDMIILALIMHDGFKHGLNHEKYVKFEHPIISAEFVKEHAIEVGLTDDEGNLLYDLISSHMGIFNTSNYSKVVLPLPKSNMQKFVHLCDDLASKKFLDLEFDENHTLLN